MADRFQVDAGEVPPPDVQVIINRVNELPLHFKNKILLLTKKLRDIVAIREFGQKWYDLHEEERNIPGFKDMVENIYMNKELINRRIRAAQDTLDEMVNEFQQNDDYEDIVDNICNHVPILQNARNYVEYLIHNNMDVP